jgi:UDP-N-acetylglucosamine 2-epimerase (non-hydrolysing)
MKIISVFGTRPEMIKMWSTFKLLDSLPIQHVMVHTGQNYTPELKDFFFRDLNLRQPDYSLGIKTSSYSEEIADVITLTDKVFEYEKPDCLLILGDTYSGMCVLPASNRNLKIFHMEAGLRAYDKRMPEQRNRKLIDHLSDFNLVFNGYHRENLIRENIHPSKIFVTGNPTFEVLEAFSRNIDQSRILSNLELSPKNYILVTAHRKENVDDPKRLILLIQSLERVGHELGVSVIYAAHPRSAQKISLLKNSINLKAVKIISPLGYYDYNNLAKNALCLLGDSGTTPEEGLYFKVPVVSLRDTTERPETVESSGHIVAGLNPENVTLAVKCALLMDYRVSYDFSSGYSPAQVVVNCISSNITNHF